MVLDQKIETTKNRTLFYLLFTIMISMVGIRNVLHIDFPVVLFLGVVVITSWGSSLGPRGISLYASDITPSH
jgi:hypothetical protein